MLSASVLAAQPSSVAEPAAVASSPPDTASESTPPVCPEVDTTVCGRRYFEAGTLAFEQGEFVAAVQAFRTALSVRPHPVIRYNLALSLARLGRPTAAIQSLLEVLGDPETDKELSVRAERERRSAEQSLSRVSFALSDPQRERVEIDGALVDVSEKRELTLDPGSHRIRVISGSSIVLDQELELSPNERVELRVGQRSRRIDVVVVPDAPIAKAPDRPIRPHRQPARAMRSGLSPAWLYGGLGVTAVLTGLTVWSGLDTNSALSDYEEELPRLSQAEADERVRAGHGRELRTNLLLAGSIACGLGSAALGVWFVDFGGSANATLAVGHSGLSLRGGFSGL